MSWDELMAATPASVQDALPLVPWKLDKLWQLQLPVQRLGVERFDWLLDLPLWQRDGVRFQVTPRQVLAAPDEFPDHLRRVMESDLRYPVHAVHHHDRLVILDGFHRLARAVLEQRQEIAAMMLSPADLGSISAPLNRQERAGEWT